MPMLKTFLKDRRAELDEAVYVLPVILFILLGLVNLSLLGVASVAANNAANVGARAASVAQANRSAVAVQAASQFLNAVNVGTYNVTVSGGSQVGSIVRVQVQYSVPNFYQGLAGFLGFTTPATFDGIARADFRVEGW